MQMPSLLQNVSTATPLNGEPLSKSRALGITCHRRRAAISPLITAR
jgi:hypothetical protein